ncbi:MAG: hypothetical protein KBA31_00185 [Alphaproteobacteria bacterium]|nr:hypothetical protein [Alphaproteobacteria bacterium]
MNLKRKTPSLPGRDGNPLALEVARGHERTGKSEAVVRNLREHPIDTLLERGTIEAHHHQAAERFMGDWQLAQVGSPRSMPLEARVDGARGGDLTESQADAIGRLKRTLNYLGPVDKLIVTALVVDRANLTTIGALMYERGFRWPEKRYAGPRLCEALDVLAQCYGLATRPAAARPVQDRPPV